MMCTAAAPTARLAPSQAVIDRDDTLIDSVLWLQDIRDQYPLVGVLQLCSGRWMAVWVSGGQGWQIDARTPVDLYGKLRRALAIRPTGP